MKVTVIPVVVRALGIVPKNLEKRLDELEIRGRIKTTTKIYLDGSWRLAVTQTNEKTLVTAQVKHSQRVK